jgi:non-heme chloroperoxidase
MHYWEGAGGIRIAGDSWGHHEGQLVILLHGGGQTRHAWKGAGERFAALGYHAVALDARGHGDSAWEPDARYDELVMVADLAAVVGQLGQPHPVLVGASLGGVTSLEAIGLGQVDAAALVLVDVAPRIEREGSEPIVSFMTAQPSGFASLEDVASAIGAFQPHRRPSGRLEGLAKNVRLGEDGRYHWHWDPRFPSQLARDRDGRQKRLADCARRLTVPTLLIRGGRSSVLSERGVAEFLELCPHSEVVTLADADHMVAGDRNDRFCDAIGEFLVRAVDPNRVTSRRVDSRPGARRR